MENHIIGGVLAFIFFIVLPICALVGSDGWTKGDYHRNESGH